jgi:5-hydroxyisourate hydrolase
MGKLSTHVLDTSCGKPASGMRLRLYRRVFDGSWELLIRAITNQDGRVDQALLEGEALESGRYCLRFEAGAYFKARAQDRSEPGAITVREAAAFLDEIPIEFAISDPGQSYHVPLLVTPWSYTTYRGS